MNENPLTKFFRYPLRVNFQMTLCKMKSALNFNRFDKTIYFVDSIAENRSDAVTKYVFLYFCFFPQTFLRLDRHSFGNCQSFGLDAPNVHFRYKIKRNGPSALNRWQSQIILLYWFSLSLCVSVSKAWKIANESSQFAH